MVDNMRDMTLNLIVNSQVSKVRDFNKNLKDTEKTIDNTTKKVGWLSKSFSRLFGAYISFRGVQGLVKTYRNLDLMRRSIEGLTQSTEDWQYLTKEAFRTATDIEVVARGYRNFYAAATMAGVDKGGIQNMYSNILEAGRAVGATQYQVEGALLALEQMFSKGRVSMEELRRQLGNALPGAFEVAAKAMGVTTQEFNILIKKGVQATDLVPKFTAEYRKTFEKSFPKAMKSLDAAIVNLGTSWKLFQYDFMRSGAGTELAKVLVRISQILQSSKLKSALNSISFILGKVLDIIKYLIDNLGTVIFLLGPVMLGGILDKIVILLKEAVTWLAAGNLHLSKTQIMLFRILVLLAGVQEIIAFFTPIDGALETAILGKDQSWIDRVQYLLGSLTSIFFMLDALLGFKMTKKLTGKLFDFIGGTKVVKGIKSWAGIDKVSKTASTIAEKETSVLLDQYGRPLVKDGTKTAAKTVTKKGAASLLGRFNLGIGSKLVAADSVLGPLGWAYLLGDVTAGKEYREKEASKERIRKLANTDTRRVDATISAPTPYSYPFVSRFTKPEELNKTETFSPTIHYEPKYNIDASSMTVEQLKSMLDERDRNFWTSLINPTARFLPNFIGGNK